MRDLEGQSVCVVGGTAGIGRAIAARVIAAGAVVTIAGRKAERAAEIAHSVGAASSGALDVVDES
jgi:short-subunit dehydrogenase involved in D-alanine esterification of teichoic acids